MRVASLALILFGLLLGCVSHPANSSSASFAEKVLMKGTVRLVGWSRLHGEFEIYSDRESFDHELRFPSCISGVLGDQYSKDLSQYDRKRVAVTGELFLYSDLPDEERPVIPRKTLSGVVIPNGCYGKNVLLIKEIHLMP